MKKKLKFKFKNRLQEASVKTLVYFVIGILIFFFIFKISSIIVYFELFMLVIFLVYMKNDDLLGYIYGGAFMAFVIYNAVGFALSTNVPLVVVVSSSMQHDDPARTYYGWLDTNLQYNKSFVDTWHFKNGFSLGDMPVILGQKSYRIGDIIVFDAKQTAPVIHRVIYINEDRTYQTKGDNNYGQLPFEKSVDMSQIKGKVIFIIPKIGYIKIALMKIVGVFR